MRTATVLTVVVCLAACGKTNREAINELKPAYLPLRSKLTKLAASLPPAGSVKRTAPTALEPPISFSERPQAGNLNALMFDQLVDPDIDMDEQHRFDLGFSGDLLTCLSWTGPKPKMTAASLEERNGESILKTCQAPLARPYLLVSRVVAQADPGVGMEAGRFKGGAVVVEHFVVEVATSKVKTAFQTQGRTPHRITYRVKEGGFADGPKLEEALRALRSDTRGNVAKAFTASGARFDRLM